MDEVEARERPAKTAMANIPEESIDAEAASCLQYVALDAFKDKELTDHQEKQKRDDPRIQHDFRSPPMVHQLDKRCCLCVEWAVLGIYDRWGAECCLKSLQVASVLPK